MKTGEKATTTIRRMKDDDIARQMVLRYQQDANCLEYLHSARAQRVLEIARRVMGEHRLPATVGEWIALVMHYGDQPYVWEMRAEAAREADASYIQAERWLQIIDRVRS